MLPWSTLHSLSMSSPPTHLDKVSLRMRQVVITSFELFQILVVNQMFLPQVFEERKVRSAGA
jgi:hypothetical protein